MSPWPSCRARRVGCRTVNRPSPPCSTRTEARLLRQKRPVRIESGRGASALARTTGSVPDLSGLDSFAADEPALQLLDPGLDLFPCGLSHGRSPAGLAQFDVDVLVRSPRSPGPGPDETLELIALFLHRPVLEFARVRLGRRCRRGLALGLPRLLRAQQFVDLLGFEQPGDPDEVEFVF